MRIINLLIYSILFLPTIIISQSKEPLLKRAKFAEAKIIIKKQLASDRDTINFNLSFAKVYEREKKMDSCSLMLYRIEESKLSRNQLANYYYLKARVYDDELNQTMLALETYKKALDLYKKENDITGILKTRYRLFYLLFINSLSAQTAFKYLDSLSLDALKYKDTSAQIQATLGMANRYFDKETKDSVKPYLDKAFKLSKYSNDIVRQEIVASYLGLYYLYLDNNFDKAELWLDKSVELAESIKNDDAMFNAYVNRATLPRELEKYRQSLKWMYKAAAIPVSSYNYNQKASLFKYMARDYHFLSEADSALVYYDKYFIYNKSVNDQAQENNLIGFSILESTQENKRIKKENKFKEKIAWSLGGLAFALSIIGILAYTNQQRKRKIAEQQQQLEQEKVNQLLKDQELQSIDAMISGQEKERQRLANDLHDNLGSLLATLKLHFENYKGQVENKKQEKILNNTDELLEEAYQKVRGMAHTRNTGVVAKYGLLPAIENFAAKVSASQKLQIDVSYNTFEERLDNTTEITLFRILQELITNVIKHAKATEVQLQLTAYEQQINILLEDNGRGFDTSRIPEKEGMGLTSIRKRVELAGGSFSIDSTIDHGTTININFPIS